MAEGIGAESLKEILVQVPPTMTQFMEFRKHVQEELAKLKTAEKLRERFDRERRWWIGITIALVALAAASFSRIF